MSWRRGGFLLAWLVVVLLVAGAGCVGSRIGGRVARSRGRVSSRGGPPPA